jgi:hypothetical protein
MKPESRSDASGVRSLDRLGMTVRTGLFPENLFSEYSIPQNNLFMRDYCRENCVPKEPTLKASNLKQQPN